MMLIDELAAWLGIKRLALVAAIAGGLISLKFAPDVTSVAGRALCVAQSAAVAIFGGPALAQYLQATSAAEIGIVLLTGALCMSLLNAIVRAIRALDIAALAASWLKRPGSGS